MTKMWQIKNRKSSKALLGPIKPMKTVSKHLDSLKTTMKNVRSPKMMMRTRVPKRSSKMAILSSHHYGR